MMINLSGEEVCALEHALKRGLVEPMSHWEKDKHYHSLLHRKAFQRILAKMERVQAPV